MPLARVISDMPLTKGETACTTASDLVSLRRGDLLINSANKKADKNKTRYQLLYCTLSYVRAVQILSMFI